MLSLIVLFTFIISPKSDALDRCGQVPLLTCSPGKLKDGTGFSGLPPSIDDRANKILAKRRSEISKEFEKALKSANQYDVNYALSATGAGVTEQCEATAKAGNVLSGECLALTVEGLTGRAIIELRDGRDEDTERREFVGALEDEYELRQTELYRSVVDPQMDKLKDSLGAPQVEKHLKDDLLPKIKKYFVDLIQENVKDEKQKKMLSTKINAIRFGGTKCSEKRSQGLDGEFMPNAFYDGSSNKFYFCKGFMNLGLSDFNAVHTIAHELAHSIDPCLIQLGPAMTKFEYKNDDPRAAEDEHPFGNVLKCLRDRRSIGAKVLRDEAPGNFEPRIRGRAHAHRQGRESEDPIFCENDQIGESFSDWVGTEVLTQFSKNEWKKLNQRQYQNGVANVWRGFCVPGKGLMNEPGAGVHPASRDRLDKLVLTHPYIRKRLGCSDLKSNRDISCDSSYQPTPSPQEADNYEEEEIEQ